MRPPESLVSPGESLLIPQAYLHGSVMALTVPNAFISQGQVVLTADMWARVHTLAEAQRRSVSNMTALLVEQAMLEYGHLETKAEFLAKSLQDSRHYKEKAQRIVEILEEP